MCMKVCNGHFAVVTEKNVLLRFSSSSSKITSLEITKKNDDLVHNIFLDPRGWHTIISMQSGNNYYTNRGMKKVKPLPKMKDLLINSVAWNKHNTSETTTQEILLGTDDGHIYETTLLSDEGRLLTIVVEQYWKQLASLGQCVTGLDVVRFPPGSTSTVVGKAQRCVVLATTPSRLHQFAGWIKPYTSTLVSDAASAVLSQLPFSTSSSHNQPFVSDADQVTSSPTSTSQNSLVGPQQPQSTASVGLFRTLFTPSSDDKFPSGSKFIEFPKHFGYSDLKLYQATGDELPSQFAWMTGSGIYFGELKTDQLKLPPPPSNPPPSYIDVFAGRSVAFLGNAKLIPYPVITSAGPLSRHHLGICLTQFHVIILYPDQIKAINVLTDRVICSLPVISPLGGQPALGLWRDPGQQQLIWLYGRSGAARLTITDELCRIWQIYTDRLQFDSARQVCQNEMQTNSVNIREAEHCFKQGDYIRSARLYASTSIPFEEVALRFSHLSLAASRFPPVSTITRQLESPPLEDAIAIESDQDVIYAIQHQADNEQAALVNAVNGDHKSLVHATADPLKELVSAKLEFLLERETAKPTASSSSGQLALLAVWLVELMVGEKGRLRDLLPPQTDDTGAAVHQDEFRSLFGRPLVRNILPHIKNLLYDTFERHADDENIILLAELLNDSKRLIDHYMSRGNYQQAIRVMSSGQLGYTDRVYAHSLQLVSRMPSETVDIWLRLSSQLDPVRLLPAIELLPTKDAIRYLKITIDHLGCVDQAVHHLLISLYANQWHARDQKSDDTNNETDNDDELTSYLEQVSVKALDLANLGDAAQSVIGLLGPTNATLDQLLASSDGDGYSSTPTGNRLTSADHSLIESVLPYDPGFALRTCHEVGHLTGVVFILRLLGMHEQAMQAAIEADNVTLAKHIAHNEALSQETRRELWIKLARHVIVKNSDINEATNFLRECPLLKFEDILPYFRDSSTLDEFKDAICNSLDAYNDRIEEVKREIGVTMQCTNDLHEQIDRIHDSYTLIESTSSCIQCGYALVSRAFHVFWCGHHIHTSCLLDLAKLNFTDAERARLTELTVKLNRSNNSAEASPVDCQAELDQLIASDCMLCGERPIDNVSQLFFPSQASYEAELAAWQ